MDEKILQFTHLIEWVISLAIALPIAFTAAAMMAAVLNIGLIVYVGILRCLPHTWERQERIESLSEGATLLLWARRHPHWGIHPILITWTVIFTALILTRG